MVTSMSVTVEPEYNEPLYYEVLCVKNNNLFICIIFFTPDRLYYGKILVKEPRYNEFSS